MKKSTSTVKKIRGNLELPSRLSFLSGRFIKGFTLVELLIVMSVIGAMATLFIVNYPASQRRARDTIRRSDIKQYQTALEIYAAKNNGQYPAGSNLYAMCTTLLGAGSSCPDDPKFPGTSRYSYSPTGTTAYRLSVPLEYSATGVQQYFVVFSSGQTCTSTSSSSCP